MFVLEKLRFYIYFKSNFFYKS